MANGLKSDPRTKAGSFFLTEDIISQALKLVSIKANIFLNDKELSDSNKFGILSARIRSAPIDDVIIGDINEANNNPDKFRSLLIKARWGLRKASQYDMKVSDIFNEYPENIEYGDFLFVGTAVDINSRIFVAVCATENSNDDILAQELIDQIKILTKQARDKYIAENQDKLKDRI